MGHRLRRRRRLRRDINHFSWTRVVKLLTGFLLDSLRVCLELSNLAGILGVVFLDAINLFLQALILTALGPVDIDAIGSEHYVYEEPDRQDCHSRRSQAATNRIQLSDYGFSHHADFFRP